MKRYCFLLVFTLHFFACSKKSEPLVLSPIITPIDTTPIPTPELIFNTGFENTSIIQTSAQTDEFRGKDLTFSSKNDWVTDFINHPNIGLVRTYYEEGDSTQRRARIVADPLNPGNKVLNYKLLVPHINLAASSQYTVNGILFDKKARIQMDIYGNNNLKEIYQSVRLFIPTDFNKLVNSPFPANGDWITLFEFWNNAQWNAGATYPFRFGVTLSKISSGTTGSPFFFQVEAQKLESTGFVTVWKKSNTSFIAPIGKWMTIEYYIKEGNKGKGRFYFAVTPDGGTKTVIYDVTEDTCHPDDPNPDGLGEINPIKLYTSNNMINQMNSRGGLFQVYWDDFMLWKNKRP